MARIINVIRHPHLVTFRAYDTSDYRCCGVCDYQVIIETDDGKLLMSSVLDEDCMADFDLDEAIRKESDDTHNQDWFYRFTHAVGKDDIDNFVNGQIEQSADHAIESFCDVLARLRESNCIISNSGMEALKMLKNELDRTIENASIK